MASLSRSIRFVIITILLLTLGWLPRSTTRVIAQGDPCTAPPVAIAVGQVLEGDLTWEDCIDATTQKPADRYTFEAIAGRPYTVALNIWSLFPRLTVLGPDGSVVATGTNPGVYRGYAKFTAPTTGSYTIVCTGTGAFGNIPTHYRVWVRDDSIACDGATTPIADGQTISGTLSISDCYGRAMRDSFTDLYTFTGVVGGEYTITMRSQAVDAFIGLKGPSGDVVTYNNNGLSGSDARVVWRPTVTGTYTIEASSYDTVSRSRDGLGDYTIQMSGYFCASQTATIAPGQTLSGTLSTSDCPSPHRPPYFDHYFDTFTFAATAGQTYEVVVRATAYDPYAYVLDPSGAVVAENNDGGGGWDSRIVFTPATSGVYTIEATSYYYHQTGAYTVSLAATTPCTSTNAAITPNVTIDGELAFTDCYAADRPDTFVDRYTFAGIADTEYTISLSTPTFYLRVLVKDSAGRVQYRGGDVYLSNELVFYFRPFRSDVYTIEISSVYASATGPYEMIFLADANQSCTPTTTPIAVDSTASGSLSITDCYGTVRDHAYHDDYTFTGTAGEEFTITMRSTVFDSYLALYGPDGALVDQDDDGDADDFLNAKIEVTLPASGVYTIEATSYWGTTTGAYTVELASGIERCEAPVVELVIGETLPAELSYDDCPGGYFSYTYTDKYTFEAEPDTPYVIRMSAPGVATIDPRLALFNDSGSLLVTDEDSGPGIDARIILPAGVGGTMQIEAAATWLLDRVGPYTISVAVYNGEDDCVPEPSPLFPSHSIVTELSTDDCLSANRPFSYHDRYTFSAIPGQQYTIDMTSDDFDTWLILLDGAGNVVEQDDDGGEGTDSRIVFTPTAEGLYTLEATSNLTGTVGQYGMALTVGEPEAQARGTCAPSPIKIDPGQKIRNRIGPFDCEAAERPTSRHDRYAFSTVAGARYVVSMESNEFDAYLLLVGPGGAVVAENNDEAGKLNAKIDFVAASDGVYTVVATTNQPGAMGRYDLTVVGRKPDTPGVYVAATGAWFLRDSNTPGLADAVFQFGPGGGLVPLVGDWNGDGSATAGLYNPATGVFFLRDVNGPGAANAVLQFGAGGGGVVPLVGDWDGDGVDTIGLYSTTTGAFFLRNANAPGPADLVFTFGAGGGGITPVVGDWNGDGRDTVGLYATATGAFFLRDVNASGPADRVFTFGVGGRMPLSGDWNADGVDGVGLYDGPSGVFLLRNALEGGAADVTVGYGPQNATPVMGAWRAR